MPLIEHDASLVVGLGRLRHAFNLIDDHSVLVDGRAQKEVHGFLFDQKYIQKIHQFYNFILIQAKIITKQVNVQDIIQHLVT